MVSGDAIQGVAGVALVLDWAIQDVTASCMRYAGKSRTGQDRARHGTRHIDDRVVWGLCVRHRMTDGAVAGGVAGWV